MKLSSLNFSALSKRRQWLVPTILGALITLFFMFAYTAKPKTMERGSNLFFDLFQNLHPRDYDPDTPVRIIDIDDESIRRIGQWPWPRTVVADFNTRLAEAGAAVISYDVVFSESDRTSPENIMEVLKNNPNASGRFTDISDLKSHDTILAESFASTRVVAGFFLLNNKISTDFPPAQQGFGNIGDSPKAHIDNYSGGLFAIPELYNAASGSGYVSFQPSGDGVIRNVPLIARVEERLFPSLSAETLRVVQDASSFVIKSANASGEWESTRNKTPNMSMLRVGDFEIPTTYDGKMIVHYTKPQKSRYIPAWKILSDAPEDRDWVSKIAGHIVYIGTGSEGLKDIVTTPIRGGEPGVLVHAQITEQIIQGAFIYKPYWTKAVEFFSILFLGGILALLLPHLSAAKGIILILLMGNIIYLTSYYAFTNYSFLLDPIYSLLSIIITYVAMTLASFYMAETERSRIRGAFSLYLSPEMVKQVSENPGLLTLGGEEREISVLFLDIRSFSQISETMRPQEITEFLNKFLTPMTDILQSHEATIDKYIGDAIVAFWNAPIDDPEHEQNAARAVLEMQRKLADLNAEYRNQNEFRWPDNVRMGIGINTGICCVGNLGSEQRFSYSMIGDAANLASRIEGLTKQYGQSNLIGQATADALKSYALLEADTVSVVGRVKPETIYILAGDETVLQSQDFESLKEAHNEFLKTYRSGEWTNAKSLCDGLTKLSAKYDIHRYYQIMSQRISDYEISPPPTDWGGIYIADTK